MKRPSRAVLIAIVALLVLVVPALVDISTDWLWFGETGYQHVFVKIVTSQAALGAGAMALAFAVLLINLRVAMQHFTARQVIVSTREGPIALSLEPSLVRAGGIVAAAVLAVLLGLYASGKWLEFQMFLHARPFGDADPVLGRDSGFYIFQMPLLDTVSWFLLTLLVLAAVTTAAVYVLSGALDFGPGLRIAPRAKRHLAILVSALFLVCAFETYLDVPRILTTPAGIIHGAANVDVAVRIPALRVLMVAALAGAVLALYQGVSVSWWPIATAVALYVAVAAGGSATAAVMHRFIIAPNEQARETQYIEHHIAATAGHSPSTGSTSGSCPATRC